MQINYKKKFIILKNKYSNIKGYRPKGHMKLEIKGAHTYININIENAEADSSYTLTLISEEIIELGKIYTDSYGRTKSEIILSTEDFLQGELEEGAIIIHRNKEVLLGEYMDKNDGRIEEFVKEEPEPDPELEEYELQEDFIEDLNLGYVEELEVDIDVEEIKPEEIKPEEFEFEEVEAKDYVDLEYEYNVKKMEQTTNYVLSILRYFPYAEPFKQELYDHNWWKIDYNGEVEEGFLPYFDYVADTNAIELMEKYKHYLFGIFNQEDEIKYYIYGVPGEFTKDEHPKDGESGFKTWFEGAEEVGYWLLYIDPMTGKVIEPLDPMNPS